MPEAIGLTAQLVNLAGRDSPVFDIWQGEERFARASRTDGEDEFTIEIFPRRDGGAWNLALNELHGAVQLAMVNMIESPSVSPP